MGRTRADIYSLRMQVLYCLVVLFTLMYGVILAIDYGFFEDIIVLIYSLLMGILRKLIV